LRDRLDRGQLDDLLDADQVELVWMVRIAAGRRDMTLALLAQWFVTLQRRRMGKKNPGHNAPAGTRGLQSAAASAAAAARADRRGGQPRVAA
jgi:hypothetical protein